MNKRVRRKAKELHIDKIKRHIFLCADQTQML